MDRETVELLFKSLPDALIFSDPHGVILYASASIKRLYGWDPKELEGKEFKQLVTEENTESFEQQLKKAITSDYPLLVDTVRKGKGGESISISCSVTRVCSQQGKVIGVLIIDHQLSEEMAIQRFSREVVDKAPDAMLIVNPNGEILLANRQMEKIIGYSEKEIVGKNLSTLFIDFDKNRWQESGSSAPQSIYPSVLGKNSSGATFSAELSLSETTVDSKKLFIFIVRDVTERERFDQLKKEFVSTVSHELRTPLTAIKGAIDLLLIGRCGELEEQVKHFLEIAQRNSVRLVRLINDILDIEKIEAGKMEFKLEKVDLAELLKQTIENIQPFADTYEVHLKLENAFSESCFLSADAGRLTQVITNLLSNAIRFSPKGEEVVLRLSEEGGKIKISVIDRGPGIDPEFRKRLFQRFSQHESSDGKGTGLGLYISKLIVDRLGGVIEVESKPGKGSIFYILMDPAGKQQFGRKKRILICDDDKDVTSTLKRILEDKECLADPFDSTESAFEAIGQHHYDLLILDIILPGASGLSLLDKLRHRNGTNSSPVIMMSRKVSLNEELINTNEAFPIVAYLKKPIDISQFEEIISRLLYRNREKAIQVLHTSLDNQKIQSFKAIASDLAEVETVKKG